MFCGLLGLRFNVKITFETGRTGIVHSQSHKISHVVEFKLHVGIKECFISFASAPENVTGSAEFNCCINCVFDLRCGISKNIGVRRSAGTVHVSGVVKAVGGTPKQFLAVFIHQLLNQIRHFFKVFI